MSGDCDGDCSQHAFWSLQRQSYTVTVFQAVLPGIPIHISSTPAYQTLAE